jgi:uncharacterized membrane protein
MAKGLRSKKEVIRVEGKLKEVITVHDEKGRILHKLISPLMLEFHPRDVLQIMIGAAILAIPVGYTEETWNLGQMLPLPNVIGFLILSLVFIAAFVYYNYYREHLKEHLDEFVKRVFSTYIVAFVVVGILLTLIQKAPWSTDWILAFKRTIIVTFPSSMSAAVADIIK